jgi:hypothetical protein
MQSLYSTAVSVSNTPQLDNWQIVEQKCVSMHATMITNCCACMDNAMLCYIMLTYRCHRQSLTQSFMGLTLRIWIGCLIYRYKHLYIHIVCYKICVSTTYIVRIRLFRRYVSAVQVHIVHDCYNTVSMQTRHVESTRVLSAMPTSK